MSNSYSVLASPALGNTLTGIYGQVNSIYVSSADVHTMEKTFVDIASFRTRGRARDSAFLFRGNARRFQLSAVAPGLSVSASPAATRSRPGEGLRNAAQGL